MALPILEIPKRYKDGQPYFEAFVDDIKFSSEEWALAIVRSMNQFGQDVFGSSYPFNNTGLPTRAIPLIDYLAALSENETVTGNWTFSGTTTFGTTSFGGPVTFGSTIAVTGTSSFTGKITANDIDINGSLRYQDASNLFYYTLVPGTLAASRNMTLPDLAADDVFAFINQTQTLANKTLTTPTIASFINATHNHLDAAGGGTLSLDASVITSGTLADARISQSSVTQHQAALSLAASQITSGTLADARISQSSVTQHQAALSIAETQIPDGSIFPRLASNETITGIWVAPTVSGSPTANGIYRQGLLKFYFYYNGSSDSIGNSYNITSITKAGTGDYDVVIDTNFAGGDVYSVTFGNSDDPNKVIAGRYVDTSGTFTVRTRLTDGTDAAADDNKLSAHGNGTQ